MAKGDGSIQEIRRGVYRVSVSLGRDPLTGKYRRVTRTVHGSKADARKVRDAIRSERDAGIDPDAGSVAFRDFARNWLEGRRSSGELAESTLKRYDELVATLCDYFGDAQVNKITPASIDSAYLRIRSERGISGSTMNKLHTLMKQIMKRACEYDMVLRNPCDRVKAPKRDTVKRRSLTRDEGAELLERIGEAERAAYAENDEKEARQLGAGNAEGRAYLLGITSIACAVAARVGLATGARRGEVLGATWQAVNLDAGTLRIEASVTASGKVKGPKSAAGVRRVALDARTVESLRRWKRYQARELAKIGKAQKMETPVFSDAKGGYMNPCNFSRWWRSFTADSGFEGLKFHELRHTQATQLLANGVDVKTVQTRLGHANASITLNLYAHAVPENDKAAADLVGELFGGMPAKKAAKGRIIPLERTA